MIDAAFKAGLAEMINANPALGIHFLGVVGYRDQIQDVTNRFLINITVQAENPNMFLIFVGPPGDHIIEVVVELSLVNNDNLNT